MAAVAVLRNDTLQAFLQVREKFEILLKMPFVARASRITRKKEKTWWLPTSSVSELRKLLQITRHFYFIWQEIIRTISYLVYRT